MSGPDRTICIVGGAGHVGAPLAIVLSNRGWHVIAYDINARALGELAEGRMPFIEYGAEPLLRQALYTGSLYFTGDASRVAEADTIIITVGTPIDEFHNPRLDVIARCIDSILPYVHDGQTVILRSTVYPGVTEYVHRYLDAAGKRVNVAFCPERVVQGHATAELQSLPQIVSGISPKAESAAAEVFGTIAPKIVRMTVKEAEFAKLISNAYRYIQFAAANQLYMMIESAGLDHARLLAGLREDYPRMNALPGPGFAAGPCLMKDTMQLVAFDGRSFSLGHEAMRANEGLPNFLVERLRLRRDLSKTRVGILGMAFKADVDDIREALSYKLGKILRFHGATVLYSDEFAQDPTFVSKEELLRSSDVVIVGVPHSAYRGLDVPPRVECIDLWGVVAKKDGPPA